MKKSHLLGVTTVFLAVFLVGTGDVTRAVDVVPTPILTSFYDDLLSFDDTLWRKSMYGNGSPFDCTFVKNNITHSAGKMKLQITEDGAGGYSCAEYQTVQGGYGYGTYSARIKASNAPGVVTAFFVFHGDYGHPNHNEIDFEFLGQNPRQVQLNYFNHGEGINGEHESIVYLAFDASVGYHTYTIKWSSGSISWWIDGVLVRSITAAVAPGQPGVIPDPPVKLQVSLWNVDSTAAGWAGTFNYPGTPIQAWVDWVEFTQEPNDCYPRITVNCTKYP